MSKSRYRCLDNERVTVGAVALVPFEPPEAEAIRRSNGSGKFSQSALYDAWVAAGRLYAVPGLTYGVPLDVIK